MGGREAIRDTSRGPVIHDGLRCHSFASKTMKDNLLGMPGAPTSRKPTRKEKRKSSTPDMLSRKSRSQVSRQVDLNAVHKKGAEPYVESKTWLELRGTATEPVNGVTDVRISMWLRETPKMARHGRLPWARRDA
jgi:hypothetical protein